MARVTRHPSSGRASHNALPIARQRSTAPRDFWHRRTSPLEFGREEFRITALRGTARPTLLLDDLTEAFDWNEDGKHVMSGSLTLRRPLRDKFNVGVGDEVRCEASPWGQGRWRELWRMRLTSPSFSIQAGQYVYQLADDMVRLNQSSGDFKFRADKAHPHGWLGHEVILHLAKVYGFRVAQLPRFRYRIRKYTATGVSPLHVIAQVLTFERTNENRRFFVRWQGGGLAIVPFVRSSELLLMAGTVIDGTVSEDTSGSTFATALEVVGTRTTTAAVKDSKGHRKRTKHHLHVIVESADGMRRYGRIVHTITAPAHANSEAELRAYGRRQLAKLSVPNRQVTITHEGIPTLRCGHALMLSIPEADIVRRIVFVSAITHRVSNGQYTMDVTVDFDDPFIDKTTAKTAKKKRDAARRHGRRTHDTRTSAPPRTQRYAKHTTAPRLVGRRAP